MEVREHVIHQGGRGTPWQHRLQARQQLQQHNAQGIGIGVLSQSPCSSLRDQTPGALAYHCPDQATSSSMQCSSTCCKVLGRSVAVRERHDVAILRSWRGGCAGRPLSLTEAKVAQLGLVDLVQQDVVAGEIPMNHTLLRRGHTSQIVLSHDSQRRQ